MSDCLSSYDPAQYAKHKCIAHHLRAISKAMKYPHTNEHTYLLTWRTFFHGVIALYRLQQALSEQEFICKRKLMEDWRGFGIRVELYDYIDDFLGCFRLIPC